MSDPNQPGQTPPDQPAAPPRAAAPKPAAAPRTRPVADPLDFAGNLRTELRKFGAGRPRSEAEAALRLVLTDPALRAAAVALDKSVGTTKDVPATVWDAASAVVKASLAG